jgi:hypothetical protein
LCRTNSIKFFFLLQKVCIIDGKLTLKIEHVDNTVRKAFYVYLLLDHSKLYVFMSQDRLWKEILTTDRQKKKFNTICSTQQLKDQPTVYFRWCLKVTTIGWQSQ